MVSTQPPTLASSTKHEAVAWRSHLRSLVIATLARSPAVLTKLNLAIHEPQMTSCGSLSMPVHLLTRMKQKLREGGGVHLNSKWCSHYLGGSGETYERGRTTIESTLVRWWQTKMSGWSCYVRSLPEWCLLIACKAGLGSYRQTVSIKNRSMD